MITQNRSQPQTTTGSSKMESLYHTHDLAPNQCTSIVIQTIDAPLSLVWSVVRRFDNPQAYKLMVRTCDLSSGDGRTGSVREVTLMSGLPACRSTERLHQLDDDLHLMKVDIIGGDHKLVNYRSTTTLHEAAGEGGGTVVMESYVVDVPADSSVKDTCLFGDTIIGCNLKSLARISEKMAVAFALSLK